MRVINVRLLLALVCLAMVTGSLVAWVHGIQVRRHAAFFLRQARDAQSRKQADEALKHFERYLQLEPEDGDAWASLGGLLAENAREVEAFSSLEQALRRLQDRADVRRRLVEVAIRLGRYRDAKEHLERHLLKAFPDDSQLREQLGRCLAATGQYREAAEALQSAIYSDPGRIEVYRDLAVLLRHRLDKPSEADRWMEELVKANPQSPAAHVACGEYLRECGQTEEAARQAAEALRLAPRNVEALLLAAQCALQRGQSDAGYTHASLAVKVDSKQVRAYSVLADLEIQRRRPEAAITWLRRGLEAIPNASQLQWHLASVLIDTEKTDEAKPIIERLRARDSSRPLVQYLDARIALVQRQWRDAAEGLEQVVAAVPEENRVAQEGNRLLAICYERLGDQERRRAVCRKLVVANPGEPSARLALVAALADGGRLTEAVAEYRHILASKQVSPSELVTLARLLVRRSLPMTAGEATKRAGDEVQELLEVLAKTVAPSSAVESLRAETLLARGRTDAAQRLLEEACNRFPDDLEPRLLLVTVLQRKQQWDRVETLLGEVEQTFGDRAAIRVVKARGLVARTGKKAVPQICEWATMTDGIPAQELPKLRRGLLGAARAADASQEAQAICRRLCEQEPDALENHALRWELAFDAQDLAEMEQALAGILRVEGHGPLWHYATAVYLAMSGERGKGKADDAIQKHLAEAARLRPTWSQVAMLEAEIHERQGRQDAALQDYQRALDLGERSPRAIRRTVELLYRQGRYGEADRVLRRLEDQMPWSDEIGRLASCIAIRLDDSAYAIEKARQIAARSQNFQDHVWLGQLLAAEGRQAKRDDAHQGDSAQTLTEAEASLRRAVELAPQSSEAWASLVRFLNLENRRPDAEAVLQQAKSRLALERAPLILGSCYEAMGQRDAAAKEYERALSQSPEDPATLRQAAAFFVRAAASQLAEPHLRRILSAKDSRPHDVAWARRTLASLLRGRGYRDLKEALRLVEANLAAGGTYEDDREKAAILSAFPDRAGRREAAGLLERLVARSAVSSGDRILLAQLYLRDGDLSRAAKHLRIVASAEADQPLHLALYVDVLLQRNECQEAAVWLERLQRLAPAAITTHTLQATLACQRGEAEKAIAVLKGFLSAPAARPGERDQRPLQIAAFLEKRASEATRSQHPDQAPRLLAEAERILRQEASKHPDTTLTLAEFLARQACHEDALALIQKVWTTSPSQAVGNALAAVVSNGELKEPQRKQAEKILQKAIEVRGRETSLLLVRADLAIAGAQLVEAENLYREILRRDKDQVIAINNLAVLLALQPGRGAEALSLAERAVEIAGPQGVLLDSRAMAYLGLNRAREALADLENSLADAIRPTRYFHQAQAYRLLGEEQAAATALAEARSQGLRRDLLHPLERPIYDRLQGN